MNLEQRTGHYLVRTHKQAATVRVHIQKIVRMCVYVATAIVATATNHMWV
jgi:hypothetical protein